MVIPAGQTLFARLFGQADDMHASGSFLHSAFYGGRIAGAMTFGLAAKLIRGGSSMRRSRKKQNNDNENNKQSEDDSEKYSEENGGSSEGGSQ